MNRLPELEHESTEDCWCGPRCSIVLRDDGSTAGYVYIHHSVNGDELPDGPPKELP